MNKLLAVLMLSLPIHAQYIAAGFNKGGSGGGCGTPTLLSSVAVSNTTGSGNATSTSINTTGATLLVVVAGRYGSIGSPSAPLDSQSNSWSTSPSPLTKYGNSSSEFTQIYFLFSPSTSATHTFTTVGSFSTVVAAAFSGVCTGYDTGSDNGGTPFVSNSFTLSAFTPSALDLVVSAAGSVANAQTYSVSGGGTWNAIQTVTANGSNTVGMAVKYQVLSSTASFQPTWTCSAVTNNVMALEAGFKP